VGGTSHSPFIPHLTGQSPWDDVIVVFSGCWDEVDEMKVEVNEMSEDDLRMIY